MLDSDNAIETTARVLPARHVAGAGKIGAAGSSADLKKTS